MPFYCLMALHTIPQEFVTIQRFSVSFSSVFHFLPFAQNRGGNTTECKQKVLFLYIKRLSVFNCNDSLVVVSVSIISFLLVFVLNAPKQRERTFRPCIWTHGTLTPVWMSHRCPHWLRRITLCYASTLDLWLDISIIIPFACYRLRYGLHRSVRVLKTSNGSFGCSLLWLVLSDSKRKVKGTLIFSCQGTFEACR